MIFMGYTCLAFTRYLKIVLLSDSIAELDLSDRVLPCKQALTISVKWVQTFNTCFTAF